MPEKSVAEKVVCYIIKNSDILVFRHVDFSYEEVGIQVPAGTIERGESPESAATREAMEETGLTNVSIVKKLGVAEYDISPYRYEIQRRHVFQMSVNQDCPERWLSQEEHDGNAPPTKFECFWIPLENAHVLQSGQGALLGLVRL